MAMYGDVVGAAGVTPDDFSRARDAMVEGSYADVATLANAMSTPDSDWDRDVRDDIIVELSTHGSRANRLDAQSSAEFAAMDVLTSCGYTGVDDAVAAFSDLSRVYAKKSVIRVLHRQFSRSRHAIVGVINDGKERIPILTPWCVSKRAAMAYAGVILHGRRRVLVEERAVLRAATVLTYSARKGLQSLRDVVEPALALLKGMTYSPQHLAFVDSAGVPRQSLQTRTPYVWVAFSTVFSRGSVDVLLEAAKARAAMVTDDMVSKAHPSVADYNELADDVEKGLALHAYSLGHMRAQRLTERAGQYVNKGPMLGYVARGRTAKERNTMACINRINEVRALVDLGATVPGTLFVVDWGGDLDHSLVLASAAAAKLDIALDIVDSGIDLPGHDIQRDDGERIFNYQLYLSSARQRKLPRMPLFPYADGTPLQTKLGSLYDFYSGGDVSSLAYISGGIASTDKRYVGVCTDAAIRTRVLQDASVRLPITYYCVEILHAPVCDHALRLTSEEFLNTHGNVDQDCPVCHSHYRSFRSAVDAAATPGLRLVKPRSMFFHNSHFSLEWAPWFADPVGDSMTTIDACVASNVLRNHSWASDPTPAVRGADPCNDEVSQLVRGVVEDSYRSLAGDYHGKLPDEYAGTIAESL
jgi:hypothetical protein